MKAHEIKPLEEKIAKYHALATRLTQITHVLNRISSDDPAGPHGSGPFTGNTRESRQIDTLEIFFTPTRGGSPGVRMNLIELGIEAYSFGQYLESALKKQRDEIIGQMEKL